MNKEISRRFDGMESSIKSLQGSFENMEGSIVHLKHSMDDRFELLVGHIADMRVDIDYLKENMADKKDIQKMLDLLDFYIKKADLKLDY